jgi:hypothetical protein
LVPIAGKLDAFGMNKHSAFPSETQRVPGWGKIRSVIIKVEVQIV